MGNHIVNWNKNRIKRNKNSIIVINGQTGSGKSYAGLELARETAKKLGTNFTIKDNVDFTFTGLLKKSELEQNSKPGTCFLFEEVGAFGGGASSREWQSKANKFFFSFLQTTRHRNQILIFTCPNFSNLDAGARSLVHIQLLMKRINYKEKIAYVKPFILQVNDRTGKIYFKLLRFTDKSTKKTSRLDMQKIPCPPNEMVEEYEKIKLEFTKKLNQSIIDDEEKGKSKAEKNDTKLNAAIMLKVFQNDWTIKEAAEKLNKSEDTIKYWKRKLGLTKKPTHLDRIETNLLGNRGLVVN